MELKWIKMATDIFDNRKIRQLESLTGGDTTVVMWFKLLCLAGTVNDGGYLYLTKDIPYTEKMIATQFGRPIATVQKALRVFESFGMIEISDGMIRISNWEKYQNIEGMDKVREQNRLRKQLQREREKSECHVTGHADVTQCHATEKEIDIDNKKEKDIEKEKHQHGANKNVLLTDEEFEKLKAQFADYDKRIDNLSFYLASTGKSYKSHYMTILNWARKEEKTDKPKNGFRNFQERDNKSSYSELIERMRHG